MGLADEVMKNITSTPSNDDRKEISQAMREAGAEAFDALKNDDRDGFIEAFHNAVSIKVNEA